MNEQEEIIIDGVNVKDCKRRIGKNSYCRYFKRPCADNNFNCIWKQHERLKEENEKLRKINHELAEEHKTIGQDLYAEIKNYRKEKENLKEENERLKKIKDDFFKQAEISHQAVQDKNKIIEKLETVIQEIKQLVSTDYIKNKKQLVQNYDCLDNFMQKIEDKCNEVQQ